MPTVIRVGRFRLFFYSNEGAEPAHIHVQAGDGVAKFWLEPVELADSIGCTARDIAQAEAVVRDHRDLCLRSWHEHFPDKA